MIQPFYGITYSVRSFAIVTAAGLGNLPAVIGAGFERLHSFSREGVLGIRRANLSMLRWQCCDTPTALRHPRALVVEATKIQRRSGRPTAHPGTRSRNTM